MGFSMRCTTLAATLVVLAAAAHADTYLPPSTRSPLGDPKKTPQFILFTHDDAVMETTHELMLEAVRGHKSKRNGCWATATMFTIDWGNNCELMMDLYSKGFEIADHTRDHTQVRGLPEKDVRDQIVKGRDELSKCGVPKSDIVGFRAPYLATDEQVRKVLHDEGFLYDSTLVEEVTGASLSRGESNRVWPFSMDHGVPMNCGWFAGFQSCSKSERLPGLVEVPVWHVHEAKGKGVWSMDYGSDGRDVFDILKYQFDQAYNGNRAPVPIFIHTPWLQNKENLMGVKKFLAYALAHDDTYAVSIRQMINWMQNPVPADQLTKQLLGCGNKGGAGGDLAGFLAGPAKPAPVVGPAGQAQAVHSGNGVASKSVVASGPFDTLLADVVAAAEEAKAAAARSPFENLLHDLTN